MSSVPDRSEIDAEYTWDLGSLFADDEAWEDGLEEAEAMLEDLRAFDSEATADAESLLSLLETHEAVMRQVSDVRFYAQARSVEDTRDGDAQAMSTRADSLQATAKEAASFIEPAIQDLGPEEVQGLMATEPALEEYDHYLDDVRRTRSHTRSPEVESLLAELGDVTDAPEEVFSMLANADMDFPTVEGPDGDSHEITRSNFQTLMRNPDRDFRQRVYEAFFDEWATVRNAVATTFRKNVTADRKLARARNYETAREEALDEPNVPVEVYDTLVDTVRDNLGPLHRQIELKRDVLGADEFRMWDVWVPMAEGESPDIPYEQACEWIEDAVAPLGEDYQDRLAAGLDSRWIDVYETTGKRSGAFSGGTYDSQPYIMLNYQDDVASLFTLAHELGHSLHTELANETQPWIYHEYELFVAEIASTVTERLLTHHLLDVLDDEHLRQHVLNESLKRIRGTLFFQTMFAEFEHEVHRLAAEGTPLTPDRIDETFRDQVEAYYAPGVVDDRFARLWMEVPHFYMGYYVYKYATGISAAMAIADRILESGEGAAGPYREMLRLGSKKYPLDLLDGVGVDLTEPDPIEAAIGVYDEYVDAFERVS
jgi:oligoendopeptidase F